MIKRKVKPFKAVDFSKIAQQKFIDVNTALQKNDRYLFRLDVCYSYVNIHLNTFQKINMTFLLHIL